MPSANQIALRLVTKAPGFWQFVSDTPALRGWTNRLFINLITGSAPPRPYPFSLWGPGTAPCAPYTSWTGLVERRFSGRHLPPATPAEVDALPPVRDLDALFRRTGAMQPCPKSSALFCFFAQWFTDSFLRTDPDDLRCNTSNHEIDLCQIYGLCVADTDILRSHRDGLLKSQIIDAEEYPPFLFDETGEHVRDEFRGLSYVNKDGTGYRNPILTGAFDTPERRRSLFASGLERGNSTIFYCALNTVFLREHNRLCRRLRAEHADWDDDRLFETARAVNIAQLLEIVIRDYINHLSTTRFRVFPEVGFAERRPWYRTNRIAGEFDLLYRWHPLVPTAMTLEGAPLPDDRFRFNNALLVEKGLVAVLHAAASQRAGKITLGNTPWFLVPADLAAMEKSRAWRIKPYNDYRERFGLPRVTSFEELTGDRDLAERLRAVYAHVDQVDFLVGLFAEARAPDAPLGDLMTLMVGSDAFSQALTNPLLSCHVYGADTFSPAGLAGLETTSTLEDVVRRNADLGDRRANFTFGAPPERDPPGSFGPPGLRKFFDTVDFLFVSGWERFFARRRTLHRSTVFKVNLFQPTVVVLDQQGIGALFADPDLIQDYGFGRAVPPRPLVGSVTPSIFESGEAHDGPKRLYLRLLDWRAATLQPVFAETFGQYAARWTSRPRFAWADEIEDFAATFVFRWLLGTEADPADVRLVYGNIFTQRFTALTQFIPWSNYARSRRAYERILDVVRRAPDFPRIAEMAAEEGLHDREALAKQLAFLVGMNSFLGLQNLMKSLVGELSLHPAWQEALRQEDLRQETGLPAGRPATPLLDRVIRETLRLHPPVSFVFGRAIRDRSLDSESGRFRIRKGELVMGVIPFAQNDPVHVPRADVFDPDRFADPRTGARPLIWPRGLEHALVRAQDRTCPGKDAAFATARLFCTALVRDYAWTLTERPVWERRRFSLNVAAPKGPLTVERFVRKEETG
ncbi:cytochrome P450 [Methylobacterium nodulans]|uniref:Animal heme peroxidase n=1 Tax=Methylobacterium nodulans (strain LMG 21967 / CNCM I-2342 / ORS 2060) TaxID=460265 RepID=B5LS50_METNO|nr:cytochrome P450 [Methylobacterium nodulans]ACH43051.1 COX-like/CYP74 HPL fusion protein [Methylobacterium nodulans ORS 2060]ACL61267.1 Animal heme peroxidase [Methylobacterium nodulans ORS 2060]